MTTETVLAELESLGTEQTRKIYRRHGAGENLYGVSYASFGALKKRIKVDHDLALGLWASGNYDARILATMIADPERVDARLMETWAKDLENYALSDALAGLFGKTKHAKAKAEKWLGAKSEWVARTGWLLVAQLAQNDKELPDDYFERHLEAIERDIHSSRNRVRDAMNSAVIAIGARNAALEAKAIAAAKRIGKVEVDHGETGCKTPDAVEYILKMKAHRAARSHSRG